MTRDDQGTAPGEAPGDAPGTIEGEWVTVAEAARRLGVSPRAIRNRIKHHSLLSRPRGNQGREVLVTDDMEVEDTPGDSPGMVALMVQVARLEERLAAADTLAIGLRADVERERAERERLVVELTEARKPVLVRLLEALRRR